MIIKTSKKKKKKKKNSLHTHPLTWGGPHVVRVLPHVCNVQNIN